MTDSTAPMELLPDSSNRLLTGSSLIKHGEHYYRTQVIMPTNFKVNELITGDDPTSVGESLGSFTLENGATLHDDVAYLSGPYFYLFRGNLSAVKGFEKIRPGIYYDDNTCTYVLCEPETDEEKEEYKYSDKISRQDADEIREAVMNHEVIILNTPDKVTTTIPEETMDDDILKKAIKRALKSKGVDLDQCRTRFVSKNMLFNTKQVLRGPNKLSMLLFDRCAEAMNLKYTIILEETGIEQVGRALPKPIVISSQDMYDANLNVSKDEFGDDVL